MSRVAVAQVLRFVAEELHPSEKESSIVEDGSSTRDKGYQKMPNVKPPRRQTNNVSDTREYRREYQAEYRAENGNGYIPKGKRNK